MPASRFEVRPPFAASFHRGGTRSQGLQGNQSLCRGNSQGNTAAEVGVSQYDTRHVAGDDPGRRLPDAS